MFHRHMWKLIAAKPMSSIPFRASAELQARLMKNGNITNCLMRCDCGALRTHEVDGVWTLEELRGNS